MSEKKGKRRRVKKSVAVCYFEADGLPEEARRRFYAAGRMVQEATNLLWINWYREMIMAKRDEQLREFLDDYADWRADGCRPGEKPELSFAPLDNAAIKRANMFVRGRIRELHSRCLTLLVNQWSAKVFRAPSRTCRGLKLWQSVLLGRERLPQSVDLLPIPFDRQNACVTFDNEGQLRLEVRVDRFHVEGKTNAGSTLDAMILRRRPKSRKTRFVRWTEEAALGSRPWVGSQLVYRKNKKKWMVSLGVEVESPAKPEADGSGRSALLWAPESKACWMLQCGKESIPIGSGRRVERLRVRLKLAKLAGDGDVFGSPAINGHGRKRRRSNAAKLTGVWGATAATLNQQLVARVIRELKRRHIRRLEYRVPSDGCLLNRIGREDGGPLPWPLFHVREQLERKCEAEGIEFRVLDGDGVDGELGGD